MSAPCSESREAVPGVAQHEGPDSRSIQRICQPRLPVATLIRGWLCDSDLREQTASRFRPVPANRDVWPSKEVKQSHQGLQPRQSKASHGWRTTHLSSTSEAENQVSGAGALGAGSSHAREFS